LPILLDSGDDDTGRRLETQIQYFKVEMTVPMQVKDAAELE